MVSQLTEFSTHVTTISTQDQKSTTHPVKQSTAVLQKVWPSLTMPTMNFTATSMMVLSTSIVVDTLPTETMVSDQQLELTVDLLAKPVMDAPLDQTATINIIYFTENKGEMPRVEEMTLSTWAVP